MLNRKRNIKKDEYSKEARKTKTRSEEKISWKMIHREEERDDKWNKKKLIKTRRIRTSEIGSKK
jgi:hypothetical protein